LSDKFDVAERLTYLNIVCDFARDGPAGLRWLKPGRSRAERESFSQIIDVIVRHSWETPIDWDLILRIGNAWFDRIVDAYRRDDDGIVVYSVGINRRDDGAKSYDDRTSVIDDWDDIVVRLPAIP
jgi:hypothetical protein